MITSALLRTTRRRVALAGAAGALALAGGAGFAHAAGVADSTEFGYAVVVDEGATTAGAEADCPALDAQAGGR